MFRRNLPESLVQLLRNNPFWNNLLLDRTLRPEIRDDHITVYYRGGALIRKLQRDGDRLVGEIHPKYIPVQSSGSSVGLTWGEQGFAFQNPLQPLPMGLGLAPTLRAYKTQMEGVLSDFPEGELVQEILMRTENQILDQEIAFQDQTRDRIDLVHFDTKIKKLVMVEVKRLDDARLRSRDGQTPPEVLGQLRDYIQRIDNHNDQLLTAYNTVHALKRQLGLGHQIEQVPESITEIHPKPLLVIGHCSRADVQAILGNPASEEWQPLLKGLPEVAAGLILCGNNGCRLNLEPGSQTRLF